MKNPIQFYFNGFKINGGKINRCFYCQGTYQNFPQGTITIHAKEYRFEPAARHHLNIENNTDTQTDYFEDDRARITPTNPLYPDVLAALQAYEARHAARMAKRASKR